MEKERVWSPCPQPHQLHFAQGSMNRTYTKDASAVKDATYTKPSKVIR